MVKVMSHFTARNETAAEIANPSSTIPHEQLLTVGNYELSCA